jgi:hypothetical protein
MLAAPRRRRQTKESFASELLPDLLSVSAVMNAGVEIPIAAVNPLQPLMTSTRINLIANLGGA